MNPAKTIANGTYAENFMRSSVVPHTIANETAQNMNWKMKNDAVSPVAAAPSTEVPNWNSQPLSPANQPPPPKAIAKPTAHQTTDAIEKLTRILAIPMPAFFPREKPISRNAKPACMKKTSAVPTSTHVTLTSLTSVSSVGPSWASAAAGRARRPTIAVRAPRTRVVRLMYRFLLGISNAASFSGGSPVGSLSHCRKIG